MTTTKRSPARRILAGVRDERRQRREARDAYLKLERELSTYSTPAQVDDLLIALSGHDDHDSQVIRDILTRNRQVGTRLAS
jgi:hypothetical protein